MIEIRSVEKLRGALRERIGADRHILDELRQDVRPLMLSVRRIQPRSATAISLVGTDGGNNKIRFDPFMVQVIRVVDSSEEEYCLEIVSPNSDVRALSARHFAADGDPVSPMGRMMWHLGVRDLDELSTMIPPPGVSPKPSWVQVYRELMEWAVLLDLVRERQFATDTVIVRDGLLRSKVFAGDLFRKYRALLEDGIQRQFTLRKRRIFIVGMSRHSKVLQIYRLAMALEGVMRNAYASFVEVPRELEKKVYVWPEYARGDESEEAGGEINRFVGGVMYFVKFGERPHDPVWAIDVLQSQRDVAGTVFGYLLADAHDGFPVPMYPHSLQRAQETASLGGFDLSLLQDQIVNTLRAELGAESVLLDEFELAAGEEGGTVNE
jgi:hypothetical protein